MRHRNIPEYCTAGWILVQVRCLQSELILDHTISDRFLPLKKPYFYRYLIYALWSSGESKEMRRWNLSTKRTRHQDSVFTALNLDLSSEIRTRRRIFKFWVSAFWADVPSRAIIALTYLLIYITCFIARLFPHTPSYFRSLPRDSSEDSTRFENRTKPNTLFFSPSRICLCGHHFLHQLLWNIWAKAFWVDTLYAYCLVNNFQTNLVRFTTHLNNVEENLKRENFTPFQLSLKK